MKRDVYFHEVGKKLGLKWAWINTEESVKNLLTLEDKPEDRTVFLLCAVVKTLDNMTTVLEEMNHKLDMLYPEYRKQHTENLRKHKQRVEEYQQQRVKDCERANSRRKWLEPVVDRMLSKVPDSKLKSKLSLCIRKTFNYACEWGYPSDFQNYTVALKGPPEEWNVTEFNGIGPKFTRMWRESFNGTTPKERK